MKNKNTVILAIFLAVFVLSFVLLPHVQAPTGHPQAGSNPATKSLEQNREFAFGLSWIPPIILITAFIIFFIKRKR